MGKFIIDLIGELVEISGNSTVDTILFAIIGFISFSIAFGLVGVIFDGFGAECSAVSESESRMISMRLIFYCKRLG